MRRSKEAGLYVLLVAGLFVFAAGLAQAAAKDLPASAAYERVENAQWTGELSAKDAVLLKARLRFAPQTIPVLPPFRAKAGEPIFREPCGTLLYKEVHLAFSQFSAEEKAFLASLTPDLKAIVESREKAARGIIQPALPNYPDLDKVEPGKTCKVHYTLNGNNKVSGKAYAAAVAKYIDMAKKAETKDFKAALNEPADTGDKFLHVYLLNMGNGSWGEWVDQTKNGAVASGWIKINSQMDTLCDAKTWELEVKGTCYHEYFHGVQSAYNYASDLWFLEGTAAWSQYYYAKDYTGYDPWFNDAKSVFNYTESSLWFSTGLRKYSTSAFAWYLSDTCGKAKFFKSYFEKSAAQSDAINLVKAVLTDNKKAFADEFKKYLGALCSKGIKSISKYMPEVKWTKTHNSYGVDDTEVAFFELGEVFVKLDADAAKKYTATLIGTLTPAGNSEAMFFANKKLIPFKANQAFIASFGPKSKTVILIITDTTYNNPANQRKPKYNVILPWIKLTEVDAESPITSGDYSTIVFTYHLLGVIPGKAFTTQIKVTEKGPDVRDNVSGPFDLMPGEDATFNLYFTTGYETVGTYRFKIELRVPQDAWKMPQVKTSIAFVVVVQKPPEGAAVQGAPADEGSGASLVRARE